MILNDVIINAILLADEPGIVSGTEQNLRILGDFNHSGVDGP
jgi:hypothetical protein